MSGSLEDRELLVAWSIGTIRALRAAGSGTINRTVLVDATGGAYVLRAYRHPERSRVANEHAIIRYAAAHGVPAPEPLPLPDGDTILEYDSRFYALFPHAGGDQLTRETLTAGHIGTMGEFLGRLHWVLRDFPHDMVTPRSFAVDSAEAMERIERLLGVIQSRTPQCATDQRALLRLSGQREWLIRHPMTGALPLSVLPAQVIHGDYQQTNLFFCDHQVSAIIDWDQAYVAPRAWEVIRTLQLVWDLAPEPCAIFLQAYRAELPLELADLDLAAACYSQMRAHDTWLYDAYYLQGNERVERFISAAPFVPISQQWAVARRTLAPSSRV